MATKPPNGIYTFSGRPGSSYKYENNQWFVSNSGTKNQYVPMQDPTGNRAKTLEAGLKSGKTKMFSQIPATQNKTRYQNQLSNKPLPSETTQAVAQNYMMAKDLNEIAQRTQFASQRKEQAAQIMAAKEMSAGQPYNINRAREIVNQTAFDLEDYLQNNPINIPGQDEIKAAPEYSTLDKIENIVRNPLVAASYAMQPGDFAMPMNYSEFERSPNYQDDVWNNNLVGRGLNAASYFHPAGLIAHGLDNAMYTGTDVNKAIKSGKASDWKQAGVSALNTGLDLLAGSKFIGGSGRLLNTGENATLKAMEASNKLNLPTSVNTTLGAKVFPKFASSTIKSADDLALSKIFPQINPNSVKYNPFARNAYNNAVGIGNAQNVVEATTPLVSSSKIEEPFKSEIDWGKWNPETPTHKVLMDEYNAIEESTKKDGTWMKNPDGSAFQGTPEQFIQQQSSWFKKAFGDSQLVNPDGSPTIQYHGSAKKFDTFDESKFQLGDAGYSGQGIYTSPSKTTANSYAVSSAKFHTGKIEPTVYELYGLGKNPITSEQLIKWGKNSPAEKEMDLFNFHRKSAPLNEQLLDYDVAIHNQNRNIENIRPWHDAKEVVFPTNKQLKSAVGNVGFFDMTNPNIYKSLLPYAVPVGLGLGLGAAQKYPNGGGMKTVKSKDGTITNKFTNKEGNTVVQVKTKDGRYYEKVVEPQIKPLDNTPRYQNALLNNPAIVADNTRVVNADFAADAMANRGNVARAVAAEKKAQYEFEKNKWDYYNKQDLANQIGDRAKAFMVDPLGMVSRFVSGEQAYIPGMGDALINQEDPNRDRYLKAVGYTPGVFEPSDLQNMANPMYWGASIGSNLKRGNYGTAALETALTIAPFLPKGSGRLIKQGAGMLADDVARGYNNVATGNSFLTDLGVRAWKVERPNFTIKSSDYIARPYTDAEAALVSTYGHGMQFGSQAEWDAMEALTKSGATDFSKKDYPISRILGYYRRGEAENEVIEALKRGDTFTTPSEKSIRTWSAGVPKIDSKDYLQGSTRLIIPSRYTKDLGNSFAAMPYYDKRIPFIWNPKGRINAYAIGEKELMGNIPEGFKVIGTSKEDGLNNLIIKPIKKSLSLSEYLTTQTPLKNTYKILGNDSKFFNPNETPHWLKGYQEQWDPMSANLEPLSDFRFEQASKNINNKKLFAENREIWDKYSKKFDELNKKRNAAELSNDKELLSQINAEIEEQYTLRSKDFNELEKKYFQSKEHPFEERIGSGGYGSVYGLPNSEYAIKIGNIPEGENIAKLIENTKDIQKSNIAITKRIETTSSGEKVIVMNRVDPVKGNRVKNPPTVESYQQLINDVEELQNKGIYLDFENKQNIEYNPETGLFNIYDLNTTGHILNPSVNREKYDVSKKTIEELLLDNKVLPKDWKNTKGTSSIGNSNKKNIVETMPKVKVWMEGGSLAKNIPTYYDYSGTPIYRDTTALPFPDGGYLSLQNAMLGPLPEREKPNSVLAYNKFVEATKTPNQSAYIRPSYYPESNHYKYGFLGAGSGNIYGGAGYGVPKYGLEANVFGSLPAQSDPYYKGFYSAELAKQFGNNQVGLGVSSPVVGYTDDSGFHMDRLELTPQLSFRKNFADGGILDRIRKRLNTKEEEEYNPSKDLSLLHKYNSEVKQIQDLEESDPRRIEYEKANSQFVLDKAKYDEALKSYEDQLLLFNEYNNLDPKAKLQISPQEFIKLKKANENIEDFVAPQEFDTIYSKNYSGIGSAQDFKRIIPDYDQEIFNARRLLNNPDYYMDMSGGATDEQISNIINETRDAYKSLYPNINTVGFLRELDVTAEPFFRGKDRKYTVPKTPQVENYTNYKAFQKIFPNIGESYEGRVADASNSYSSGYGYDRIKLENNPKLAISTYSDLAGRVVPYYKPEFVSYGASNLYSPYPEFSQPNELSPAPVAPSLTYEERVYPYAPAKVYNSQTNTWENRVTPAGSLQDKYTREREAWRLRNGNNPSSHLPIGQAPGGTFADGGPLNDKTNHGKILDSVYASAIGDYYANGGMLKRADGSYSRRGLWDNIRAAAARNKAQGKPGKAPTKEMLEQAKVSSKANGGFVAGRQMYQPLDIRESYGGFLYGNGGQFPTTFSLPEDSFKQGGNNLHDSVYASSMAQYPAVYGMGGSILSMSNTPELSGEGKDLSVPENAYIYSAGGSIKKFKK